MKVAVIGTMPHSRGLAPYDDHEWEIWACSAGNRGSVLPRVTRWFEIHGIVDLKNPMNADWNKEYFNWLSAQSFPVYMQEPNDLCPQARIFPRGALLREFGDWLRMAATSSISLMIAYAILEGAEEIGVWGVDMQADSELYTLQKAGCHIMLKLAKERGIKVTVPLESCLATMPPFYGYAEASRMGMKLLVRKTELEAQVQNAINQVQHWTNTANHLRGALEMTNYVMRTFVNGVEDAELDVEETFGEVAGHPASVVHSKGMKVGFEELTVVDGDALDPTKMEAVRNGSGLLVPKGFSPAAE